MKTQKKTNLIYIREQVEKTDKEGTLHLFYLPLSVWNKCRVLFLSLSPPAFHIRVVFFCVFNTTLFPSLVAAPSLYMQRIFSEKISTIVDVEAVHANPLSQHATDTQIFEYKEIGQNAHAQKTIPSHL